MSTFHMNSAMSSVANLPGVAPLPADLYREIVYTPTTPAETNGTITTFGKALVGQRPLKLLPEESNQKREANVAQRGDTMDRSESL